LVERNIERLSFKEWLQDEEESRKDNRRQKDFFIAMEVLPRASIALEIATKSKCKKRGRL